MINKKQSELKRLLDKLCNKYFIIVINQTGIGEIKDHGIAAAEYEKALKEVQDFFCKKLL